MPTVETSQQPNLPSTAAERKLAEIKQSKLAKASENALALVADHICICIDCSISMEASFGDDTRLNAAAAAARSMIATSDPCSTAYSLVLFGTVAEVMQPKTTNYSALLSRLSLREIGSTEMNAGIELSIIQQPNRIVLLSDGSPNYQPDAAVLHAKAAGIKIDTISIGGADDKLMAWIAAETGGTFKRCDTPEQLTNHFILLEPKNYLQLEHKQE